MNRRQALRTAALGGAAAVHSLADTPAADRPGGGALPKKITGVECISLEKSLSERFWMSVSPIGGYQPVARRIILKVHTDTGVTGYGEGGAAGLDLFKKGFADLAIGKDPFMVGGRSLTVRNLTKPLWSNDLQAGFPRLSREPERRCTPFSITAVESGASQ